MTATRTDSARGERSGLGQAIAEYEADPGAAPHYCCRDFLDDQQRMIAALDPDSRPEDDTVEVLDGRKVLIQVGRLRSAAREGQDAARVFPEKYGRQAGECCLSRFARVIDFLDAEISEISRAGLADAGDPVAVREEFLDYLLSRDADPAGPGIPSSALREFLDHWGHRWI